MSPKTDQLPGLDERPITQDTVRPVRALLDLIKEDDHVSSLARSIVSWLAAFAVFKKMELDLGLPESIDSRLIYGTIVAHLKASGKFVVLSAGRNPKVLELLEMRLADIEARVKELSWDDDWIENPITKDEQKQLSAAFG